MDAVFQWFSLTASKCFQKITWKTHFLSGGRNRRGLHPSWFVSQPSCPPEAHKCGLVPGLMLTLNGFTLVGPLGSAWTGLGCLGGGSNIRSPWLYKEKSHRHRAEQFPVSASWLTVWFSSHTHSTMLPLPAARATGRPDSRN